MRSFYSKLFPNTSKKGVCHQFEDGKEEIQPIVISRDSVETVVDLCFLRVWIETCPVEGNATEEVKKASQWLHNAYGLARVLPPLHRRRHSRWLPLCVVFPVHSDTRERAPEGRRGCTGNDGVACLLSGGPTSSLLPQESPQYHKYHKGHIPPRSLSVWTAAVRQMVHSH